MHTEERLHERDKVDVGEFRAATNLVGDCGCRNAWAGSISGTTIKWDYHKCCQKLLNCLRGAVFNVLYQAKLFVEVEMEEPCDSAILSRTVQVIGVSQMELFEDHFLLELRQRKEEIYQTMYDGWAFKTLAPKKFSAEHWASNCLVRHERRVPPRCCEGSCVNKPECSRVRTPKIVGTAA